MITGRFPLFNPYNIGLHISVAITTIFLLFSSSFLSFTFHDHNAAAYVKATPTSGGPTFNDPNLKAQTIFSGLHIPTSMAFLGPNDFLVVEKKTGDVIRIINGKMQETPLLHVNVAAQIERGLLGIAVQKSTSNQVPTYVFLYYTEAGNNGAVIGNRVYRYELSNNIQQLVNPKLLLDLPGTPGPGGEENHNGGKLVIGPDHNVYAIIGDVGDHRGQAQNVIDGPAFDGTGGILRITQDGHVPPNSPLGTTTPLNIYYAYGIRNSFGIDFDPVTGMLWDTENGPSFGDEINQVKPGFNSGWIKIQGFAKDQLAGKADPNIDLVNLGGKGVYSDPKFVWNPSVAPTALKFLNSSKLGKQYQNTLFVGDVLTGNLYNFKLNGQRNGFILSGTNEDGAAKGLGQSHQDDIVLGKGFGLVTDIQVSPDGYLYILGYDGTVYKVFSSISNL
ncbi:MAG TPA: PQQ-dependent sugar dehydrogenase [Nitrososphaeraceae archaeon]|jgi:glucose/arabinose dehydrogenase